MSASDEIGPVVARELLTVEQMMSRIAKRCGSTVSLELNVHTVPAERWEMSWYCYPRPDEPQDIEYGGHWGISFSHSLHEAALDAYRHVFPDLVEPA